MSHPYRRGFSLIEVLVAVAIASLLVAALTVFVARSFTISREQFEQVRITEDARIESERISDAIRNARYIDRNNNGVTSDPQESWLVVGGAYDLAVYTNIDADTDAELVQYHVSSTNAQELLRTTRQLQGTTLAATTETTTLLRSSRNQAKNQPLFTYYASNGGTIAAPVSAANLSAVARVGIVLVVDANDKQKPDAATVATDVTPRTTSCTAGNCQLAGATCAIRPDIPLGPYQYSSSNFIETAAETCQTHCNAGAATPLPGNPANSCPWYATYAWDQAALVTGYCSCAEGVYPSPLPDLVVYGAFTNYYKEKWNFCQSTNQVGYVVCDPDGPIAPGSTAQCTYQCSSNNSDTTGGGGSTPTPSPNSGVSDPPVFVTYNVSGATVHKHAPSSYGCTAHTHLVNWGVLKADACTASGTWWSGSRSTAGSETMLAADDGSLTLECTGPGGTTSATVFTASEIGGSCN